MFKVLAQSHKIYKILSTHIPFIPCRSVFPFLRNRNFKIWPWKFKVKGMREVNVESHNVGPTLNRLTTLSFHVNGPSHSWDTAFSKFYLEQVKITGEMNVESHNMDLTFYRLIYPSFHVNRPSHSWYTTFSKFDLKNPMAMSWVRWILKVTKRVQHSIDLYPVRSMSIGHPIPEIRLFQNLTLKIQSQAHG